MSGLADAEYSYVLAMIETGETEEFASDLIEEGS
jgi:hypothetical protein